MQVVHLEVAPSDGVERLISQLRDLRAKVVALEAELESKNTRIAELEAIQEKRKKKKEIKKMKKEGKKKKKKKRKKKNRGSGHAGASRRQRRQNHRLPEDDDLSLQGHESQVTTSRPESMPQLQMESDTRVDTARTSSEIEIQTPELGFEEELDTRVLYSGSMDLANDPSLYLRT